jgi:hypothetical protein
MEKMKKKDENYDSRSILTPRNSGIVGQMAEREFGDGILGIWLA